MGLITRKPVFLVCHKVRLKVVSSATETSYNLKMYCLASLALILVEE